MFLSLSLYIYICIHAYVSNVAVRLSAGSVRAAVVVVLGQHCKKC